MSSDTILHNPILIETSKVTPDVSSQFKSLKYYNDKNNKTVKPSMLSSRRENYLKLGSLFFSEPF